MTVVSNASPLIILYNCGMLGLLQQFFGHVFIPEAVHHEVVHNAKDRQQSVTITNSDFISVRPIATTNFAFNHKLDRGEQEAIILASEIHADYLLLDDKRAQKEAKEQKIVFIPKLSFTHVTIVQDRAWDFRRSKCHNCRRIVVSAAHSKRSPAIGSSCLRTSRAGSSCWWRNRKGY